MFCFSLRTPSQKAPKHTHTHLLQRISQSLFLQVKLFSCWPAMFLYFFCVFRQFSINSEQRLRTLKRFLRFPNTKFAAEFVVARPTRTAGRPRLPDCSTGGSPNSNLYI